MITLSDYQQEAVRLRPRLLALAIGYLGDADAAEDAVQDVLLRLWQLRDNLAIPLDRLAFVATKHRCIDIVRQRKAATVSLSACPEPESPPAADDPRLESIMKAMQQLPPMQQAVMRLRHLEGMEMADIASLMGTTEAAVRKNLSRARQALRQQFTSTHNH